MYSNKSQLSPLWAKRWGVIYSKLARSSNSRLGMLRRHALLRMVDRATLSEREAMRTWGKIWRRQRRGR